MVYRYTREIASAVVSGLQQRGYDAILLVPEENDLPLKERIRKDFSDGDADFEASFYIIRHTVMPAVLTENFMMDNQDDVEFLLSDVGRNAVIQTHLQGIIKYLTAA